MGNVNSPASALLPIFKTEAQARILAWLLLDPEREQPIAHLDAVSRVSQPSTLREVNRLVQSGLLTERRAGNTRLVRAAVDSPFYAPLVTILMRTYGPASVVTEELSNVAGIERVILIGSWAARFLGEEGPPPRDVDVLVVGKPDGRALRAVNRVLEERLAQPVHITTVPASEWESRATGFLTDVLQRPHVVVDDRSEIAA
jgi:predicted nucleotidyltransferase